MLKKSVDRGGRGVRVRNQLVSFFPHPIHFLPQAARLFAVMLKPSCVTYFMIYHHFFLHIQLVQPYVEINLRVGSGGGGKETN